MTKKVAVIPGDGIGPEVIEQGITLLTDLKLPIEWDSFDWGADKWLRERIGLPKDALSMLQEKYDAIYFGALGDPRIPDMAHGREILLGLRFGLDLYVNLRPIQVLSPELVTIKANPEDIDMLIVRENTQDMYTGAGRVMHQNTPQEETDDESLHNYVGVERIIRAAFDIAQEQRRKKVTLIDKSNAIRFGGALWQRVFKEVSGKYPNISCDHLYVDVAAMEMVMHPQRFDVMVTSNLFGDILSDLGAGLVGGLGFSASANFHPGKIGLFEPVHGSAPALAGKNVANPSAAFLTLALLLRYLGFSNQAKSVEEAVKEVAQSSTRTPDCGGSSSTTQVGDAIRRATLHRL